MHMEFMLLDVTFDSREARHGECGEKCRGKKSVIVTGGWVLGVGGWRGWGWGML